MDSPASSRPAQTMDRAYWDAVAGSYHSEIFSVFDHDSAGVVRQHIERAGAPDRVAADLGCGVGLFTPLLASAFGHVHACDLSDKLLSHARHAGHDRANITYHQLDLAAGRLPFEPVDFALCINVLIMASLDVRLRAFRQVAGQVRAGGTLVLVVPSAESMLYTNFRRIDWCLRNGMTCDESVRDSLPRTGSVRELHQGVRPIGGVPTKHYVREELLVLLEEYEFEHASVEKLTFGWSSEFAEPPPWLGEPLPWCWLATARRK